MNSNRDKLIEDILRISENIYNAVPLDIPPEWLNSDLSVAQLRVLLVLQARGASRMSDIAAITGVTLPTATGVVDNLVRKGFVVREDDPQDRRLVICKLSPGGQGLINKLWTSGRFQMKSLLDGLTPEQLEKAHEVARMLLDNVARRAAEAGEGGGR